ncbi:MAG: hypothetical protein JWN89_466 [Parcubacteria group bacterium]|nr:hypothetical protein [Parcubacteria group bacterium]
MKIHEVVEGKCGYGHAPPDDCIRCIPCNDQIVRQPWMDDTDWTARSERFRTRHSKERMSKPLHDVVVDRDYARYTCYTAGCEEATVIRHAHMSDSAWETALHQFGEKHPHRVAHKERKAVSKA